MIGNLFIRTDANSRIGVGHAMRCLALAQAWQDTGGGAIFAMTKSNSPVHSRLRKEGIDIAEIKAEPATVNDASESVQLARDCHAEWIVLDGYDFQTEYCSKVKDAGLNLLQIDDNANAERYYADVILNANLHADEQKYSCREPYTRLLLGTDYALIRKEFLARVPVKREIRTMANRIIVTLGGSDPENVTAKVIQALNLIGKKNLEVKVAIGPANPHLSELEKIAANCIYQIQLLPNPLNVSDLILWADLGISGGGTTCWELCLLQLPFVTLTMAENQRGTVEELSHREATISLGDFSNIDLERIADGVNRLLDDQAKRSLMADRAGQLIDGHGSTRVVSILTERSELDLREVRENDCTLLWEWANDAGVREASINSDSISWNGHKDWFFRKLGDPNCYIFLAQDEQGHPIGQVRFEVRNNEAEIDVSVAKASRGKGYGSKLINTAVARLFKISSVRCVHAYIKPSNEKSLAAFEKASFRKAGVRNDRGVETVHYYRERSAD